jgi:hypothetical protein
MQSVNRFVPDAAFTVRAKTAAAIAADTSLLIGELVSPIGAIWNDEPKDGKVEVILQASAIVATGTYTINVITSTAADLSSPQVQQSFTIDPAVATSKWIELLIDQETLLKNDTDAKYYGLGVDVGGTSPSLKIEAYVVPPVGK